MTTKVIRSASWLSLRPCYDIHNTTTTTTTTTTTGTRTSSTRTNSSSSSRSSSNSSSSCSSSSRTSLTVLLHVLILCIDAAMCISRMLIGLVHIGHVAAFKAIGYRHSTAQAGSGGRGAQEHHECQVDTSGWVHPPLHFPAPDNVSALVPCGYWLATRLLVLLLHESQISSRSTSQPALRAEGRTHVGHHLQLLQAFPV